MAVAVILILLLTGGSRAIASSNAMPDEPLYPVKLATEEMRLTFAVTDTQKAEVHTQLAETRAVEVETMANEGKTEHAAITAARLAKQLEPGLLATEAADYLVKKGAPFREAHGLVGQAVRTAEEQGKSLTDLTLLELQAISPLFDEDIEQVLRVETALGQRAAIGGTAPEALEEQLAAAREFIAEFGVRNAD